MVAQIDFQYIKTRPRKVVSRLISYALFEGRPVTTRGQWINPLVFSQLSLWKHLPQLKKVRKPIFILGAGRSGTTILGVLLSMHRDVAYLNEPKAMWHTICPFEDVGGSYSQGDITYRLDESHATDEMRATANRIYGAYLLSTLSSRVVDKYPELTFRVPFVRALFPDAKFIFLTRNGWDTCSSIDKWSKRKGETRHGESHDWWGVDNLKWKLMLEQVIKPDEYFSSSYEDISGFTSHTDMAAVEWVATMREGKRVVEDYPDDALLVKYERLVSDPEVVLNELLTFCELDADERFMDYARETLRPSTYHEPYDLHHAISSRFIETLEMLGYS